MTTKPAKDAPARAYDYIRERILSRAYRAGERLKAQDIAQQLDISRTPVREALGQLEEKGLVTKTDWGFLVRALTLREVEDLFHVRELLEISAARAAVRLADEAWLQELRAILAAARRLLDKNRQIESIRQSRALHRSIAERGRNQYLVRMLSSIDDLVQLVGATLIERHPTRAREVLAENEQILAALERRDEEALAGLVSEHIHNSLRLHLSNREEVYAL